MKNRRFGKARFAKKNGFTLIELMITIAVAAILLAVAAPSFSSFIKNSRIDRVSQELYAVFNQTRQLAITTGRRAFMCRSTDVTGPTCLTSIASDDWTDAKLIYSPLIGVSTGTPNAAFANQAIQTVGSGLSAVERRQILVNVTDAAPDSVTVNANFTDNVVVFASEGGIVNSGAPLIIAICDDRADPENFGKYIQVEQAGHLKIRSTSDISGEINCDGDPNP